MKILEKWMDFKKYLDENYFVCENTKQTYLRAINSFFKNYKKISQGTITKFLKSHRRIYYMQSLKHFCKFKNIQNIKFPPSNKIEKPRREPTSYSLEYLQQLLEKVMPEIERKKYFDLKYILLILISTGSRFREAIELKYKDFNFDKYIVNFTTKGDKKRKSYLPSQLCQELKAFFDEKGLIGNMFCFYEDYTKTPLNKYEKNEQGILLLRQVKRMRFLKELENVDEEIYEIFRKSHSFRRTLINELWKRGKDLYSVSKFIGHKSTTTTERYFNETTKEKAIKECFDILNKK